MPLLSPFGSCAVGDGMRAIGFRLQKTDKVSQSWEKRKERKKNSRMMLLHHLEMCLNILILKILEH